MSKFGGEMQQTEQKKMFYTQKDGYVLGLLGVVTPIIMALVIAILMVFIALGAGSGYEKLFDSPGFIYTTQALCELAFVVAVVVYNKFAKVEFKTATHIAVKPKYLNWAIALVVGIGLPIFFNPLISMWEMLLKSLGLKVSEIGVPFETGLDLTLCIIILGLLPAFCEELFFRGTVLNAFRKKGVWFAVLYSAMCFSLMHAGLQQLPYTFILAIAIGLFVFYTKSLWIGILMHAANNITVLVLGFITKDAVAPTSLSAADIIYAILMAIVGAGLIVGTYFFAKKYNQPKEEVIESSAKAEPKTEGKKDVFAITMIVLTIVVAVSMMFIRGI